MNRMISAVLMILGTTVGCITDQSVVLKDDFSQGIKNWYVEGGCGVAIKEGQLLINADPADPKKGGVSGDTCTVWNRTPIKGDLRITFDVTVEHSHSGKNNINVFLFYTMPDGSSPERTTAQRRYAPYKAYHKMNGYIFTFVNDLTREDQGRIRIRRCPGFRLLSETYAYHSRAKHRYQIEIVKKGSLLEYYIDGALRLQAQDENPLNEGYFAFRTFQSRLKIDNFSVSRLVPDIIFTQS